MPKKSTQNKEYRTTYNKLSSMLKLIIADLAIDAYKSNKVLTDARYDGEKLLTINVFPTYIKQKEKLKGKNFKLSSVLVKETKDEKIVSATMFVLDKRASKRNGVEEQPIIRT